MKNNEPNNPIMGLPALVSNTFGKQLITHPIILFRDNNRDVHFYLKSRSPMMKITNRFRNMIACLIYGVFYVTSDL